MVDIFHEVFKSFHKHIRFALIASKNIDKRSNEPWISSLLVAAQFYKYISKVLPVL